MISSITVKRPLGGIFSTKDHKNELHIINARNCQHQLVLGQTSGEEKTNEITKIPELLTILDIGNSIFTLDVMG